MNAELLLAHFDRISDAPGAVLRLRRFILDLAVRGKLVEQSSVDHSSNDSLGFRISSNLQKQEGVPRGWFAGTVGDFLDLQYGKGLPASERKDSGLVPVFGSNGVVGYCSQALSEKSTVIIGRKGSAGALNLCEGPSWTTDVAYFVEPPEFFNIRYLYFALHTLDLDTLGKGVKPGLSRNDACQLDLCVPPLVEQHRIVAKVDELMALCDRLEGAQRERENHRDQLTASTHHHLNNGAGAETLRSQAEFFIGHLPRLTARPDQIKQLRQTILNLAVRGMLTQHGENFIGILHSRDGNTPGSEIRLPASWHVEPLTAVASSIVDCPHSTPRWTAEGKICVRTNQFRPGQLDISDARFVSESTYLERIQRLEPQENDILYSREGGILGVACRVPPNVQLCLGQRMMLIRPSRSTDPAFLEMVLNSPFITRIAKEKTTGGAAPRINVATVKAYQIPQPPLAEQHRIVAKVDELMALCDQLESHLFTTHTEAARLLDSVLHRALQTSA
jgi:type I restriction enzyme S subunit